MSENTTVVHLVRHGEVENPQRVLYGRIPGFHLSAEGRVMAKALRDLSNASPKKCFSSIMDRCIWPCKDWKTKNGSAPSGA